MFFGYAATVKRGLLTFPDGLSGLALLTLRLSLAGVLAATPVVAALPPWAPLVSDVLGLALLIGAFTRVAAALSAACLAGAGVWPAALAGWSWHCTAWMQPPWRCWAAAPTRLTRGCSAAASLRCRTEHGLHV